MEYTCRTTPVDQLTGETGLHHFKRVLNKHDFPGWTMLDSFSPTYKERRFIIFISNK